MRYQKTHADDISELTRLWKQAFGDTDAEIARFFRDLFPAATGFAARDGEKIAAMCFALPQQLSCEETALSGAYLYAVATDEAYRGQGLCRALLAFAEKELKKRGTDAVLLVPADEGLAAMYEKLGYSGPARVRKPLQANQALGAAEAVSPVEYAGLRETLLWDVPHVRYTKQLLEYEAGDAELYALRLGAMPGCAAAVRQDDGTIRVDELLPDARFLPALAQVFGTGTYLLPQEPYAMCKWLTEKPTRWEKLYLAFDFG